MFISQIAMQLAYLTSFKLLERLVNEYLTDSKERHAFTSSPEVLYVSNLFC